MKDTEKPLVSVVTITRNRGHLIRRAIDSVLAQTYRNVEHIIVDGASTDCTRLVVEAYQNTRVKFIALEDNYSIPRTIRIGVDQSQGKYISFLDDDDEYLPDKIEKQVALIESLPSGYGMVYCWMSYYDDRSKKFLRLYKTTLRGNIGSEVIDMPRVSGTPTYLMRKEVFEDVGGWAEDIGIISDWEFAARICQRYAVDYVPQSLVKVYVNHGACRMSDSGYYKNLAEKLIIFHTHFLKEFKQLFDKYPKKAARHYYILTRAYYSTGQNEYGWEYYKKLLKIAPTLKNLLLLPYLFVKKRK